MCHNRKLRQRSLLTKELLLEAQPVKHSVRLKQLTKGSGSARPVLQHHSADIAAQADLPLDAEGDELSQRSSAGKVFCLHRHVPHQFRGGFSSRLLVKGFMDRTVCDAHVQSDVTGCTFWDLQLQALQKQRPKQ